MSKSSKILLIITILGVLLSLGIIALSLSGNNNQPPQNLQNAPF